MRKFINAILTCRVMVDLSKMRFGSELVKRGFAKMQKGGVIMDVVNVKQAKLAESAGAVAVMALERVPYDIRRDGGVARMADPAKIKGIMKAVDIPVMAKCRIGHLGEATILEAIGVDMIDESEVLTPADPFNHVDKIQFRTPFVCGARNLGEALRRIYEGAAMIRTKGEAGTGNIIEAVRHQKSITSAIRELKDEPEIIKRASIEYGVLIELIKEVAEMQRLPVVNFAAGGIATPADAALMMQLGSDGIFVGSGIFKAEDAEKRAKAIVEAVANFDKPETLAEISEGLGGAMRGLTMDKLRERLQERGV